MLAYICNLIDHTQSRLYFKLSVPFKTSQRPKQTPPPPPAKKKRKDI